jgi:hypothetical protein
MTRKQFDQLVADAVASLPPKYRSLLTNVAILVEDFPAAQGPPENVAEDEDLLMGEFIGVPRTERALWDMPPEPASSSTRKISKPTPPRPRPTKAAPPKKSSAKKSASPSSTSSATSSAWKKISSRTCDLSCLHSLPAYGIH